MCRTSTRPTPSASGNGSSWNAISRADAARFEKKYNFTQRINEETLLYRSCDEVIATTPDQLDMIVKDCGAPAEQVAHDPAGL
jgi:hypothetical protein